MQEVQFLTCFPTVLSLLNHTHHRTVWKKNNTHSLRGSSWTLLAVYISSIPNYFTLPTSGISSPTSHSLLSGRSNSSSLVYTSNLQKIHAYLNLCWQLPQNLRSRRAVFISWSRHRNIPYDPTLCSRFSREAVAPASWKEKKKEEKINRKRRNRNQSEAVDREDVSYFCLQCTPEKIILLFWSCGLWESWFHIF